VRGSIQRRFSRRPFQYPDVEARKSAMAISNDFNIDIIIKGPVYLYVFGFSPAIQFLPRRVS
jgi:hypothetical protein